MARTPKQSKDFESIKSEIICLPESKKELGLKLLNKAEFMDAELEKLQITLLEKGWVEQYKNGENQYGFKKSSEGEVYNTLIKNYNATIKQLSDLISSAVSTKTDEFAEFCK